MQKKFLSKFKSCPPVGFMSKYKISGYGIDVQGIKILHQVSSNNLLKLTFPNTISNFLTKLGASYKQANTSFTKHAITKQWFALRAPAPLPHLSQHVIQMVYFPKAWKIVGNTENYCYMYNLCSAPFTMTMEKQPYT